ncbi:MAG: hypothetical protein IH881_18135 [Myxococcales bacterium]|nr:hypothetical protein [Myxococcales bacterium]
MGYFRRRRGYDRKLLLTEACDLQRRNKHKRAVILLRKILTAEPNNVEIHALIAPSLAELGLEFCAWTSYEHVTAALSRDGKKQSALDYYCDATTRMPRHLEAWVSRVALTRSMGRRDDARQILESALPHFRRRATRYPLISLLRCLLDIEPGNKCAALELAYLLSKTSQKYEALVLLSKLADASNGSFLQNVRRTQWRIEPSLAHSWLWLRSCIA